MLPTRAVTRKPSRADDPHTRYIRLFGERGRLGRCGRSPAEKIGTVGEKRPGLRREKSDTFEENRCRQRRCSGENWWSLKVEETDWAEDVGNARGPGRRILGCCRKRMVMRSSEGLRAQQNHSNENRDAAPYSRSVLIGSRL